MMNNELYKKVDNYIKKVIEDSCKTEDRTDDVQYQFCIIEDCLIFAIKTKYKKVESRIMYRLENNITKNFGLKFNQDFDIFPGVDINYSIIKWNVFGEFVTIRAFWNKKHLLNPNFDLTENNCAKHVFELRKLYNIEDDDTAFLYPSRDEEAWEKYCSDYQKLYNCAPYDKVNMITA